MAKVLLFILWVAAGAWSVHLVWQLSLPGWGKFLLELLITFLFLMLYDAYRWWTHRRGATSRGSSAA